MYLYCKQQGLTVFELIICICILAIITSLAAPHFLQNRRDQERRNIFPLLDQHIKFARNNAILHHSHVAICSSQDLQFCQDDQWNRGILVFIDRNNNKIRDTNELLLQQTTTNLKFGRLKWNGNITHQKIISFQGDTGLNRGALGSFYYCSLDNPNQHLRFKLGKMAILNQIPTITC